jgi:hypothetical protein
VLLVDSSNSIREPMIQECDEPNVQDVVHNKGERSNALAEHPPGRARIAGVEITLHGDLELPSTNVSSVVHTGGKGGSKRSIAVSENELQPSAERWNRSKW